MVNDDRSERMGGTRSALRKGISWRVGPVAPVFKADEQNIGGLSVLYEGRRVDDLWLVTIEIESAGNLPILPTDYEHPLRITLRGGAGVLANGSNAW